MSAVASQVSQPQENWHQQASHPDRETATFGDAGYPRDKSGEIAHAGHNAAKASLPVWQVSAT